MYNRPYFTTWVNAKKFVVQIPLTKNEPPEYVLAPKPEFRVGQDVIFDPGTGESTKRGTIVGKPYKHLGLYDVDELKPHTRDF